MTKAERRISRISRPLLRIAHRGGGGIAGNRDERIVQAGPLDGQRLDARAAVEQARSNGSGPPSGSSNTHSPPSRRASAGIAERHGAVVGAGAQADDRLQPVARLVDRAFERQPAAGDDRDALAQALGVGDDMGREDDRRAAAACSRISSSSRAWLIASRPLNGSSRTISRGRWTMVPSNWTVCAMPFDRVRIGLRAHSPSPWPVEQIVGAAAAFA